MSACTIIRVGNAQPCPLLDMHIPTPRADAMSRSASGSSTFADFPPSSSTTWRIPLAARSMMRWPTPGEPVKWNMSTRGSPVSASPAIALSSELIMFTTPAGISVDSLITCAILAAVSGVSGALLSTTALPVAIEWLTFQIAVMKGAFHGVTAPTTPYGSYRIRRSLCMPRSS
jgi:hypothetical protein